MQWNRPIAAPRISIAVLLVALTGLGCSSSEEGVSQAEVDAARKELADVGDAKSAELTEVMLAETRAAMDMADRPVVSDEPEYQKELRLHVLTGIKASDALLNHPEVTDEQRHKARQTKLALLYVGTRNDRERFEDRFGKFVQHMMDKYPENEITPVGSATWLQWSHFPSEGPSKELLPLLAEHAQHYPGSDEGLALFRKYAQWYVSQGDRAAAIEAYRVGIEHYERHPDVYLLKRELSKLERAAAEDARRQRERQSEKNALVERVTQMANDHDGYFVIHAEEPPAETHRANRRPRDYEFEAVLGLPSLIQYVESLPGHWSWKIVERFPDSKAGRDDAYALRDQLRKKRREENRRSVAAE